MSLFKHKNILYSTIEAGPWAGLQATPIPEVTDVPTHRWTGAKIPVALVRQILAFFAWSMETTKSETVVHLMFHEDLGWEAIVLPQEGHTGMTVKLLPDHENRTPTFQRLGLPNGKPYHQMGTWHHHCSASAFQSGTDKSDELTKEGIHLTTGDLGKPKLSVHARASFRKTLTDVVLSDWFECGAAGVAEHLQAAQIQWELCQPAADTDTFPTWWTENVIKVVTPQYQLVQRTIPAARTWSREDWEYGGATGYGGHGYGHVTDPEQRKIITQGEFLPSSTDEKFFAAVADTFKPAVDFQLMYEELDSLSQESSDFWDIATACGLSLSAALDRLYELAKKQLEEDEEAYVTDTSEATDDEFFQTECKNTGTERYRCGCDECAALWKEYLDKDTTSMTHEQDDDERAYPPGTTPQRVYPGQS